MQMITFRNEQEMKRYMNVLFAHYDPSTFAGFIVYANENLLRDLKVALNIEADFVSCEQMRLEIVARFSQVHEMRRQGRKMKIIWMNSKHLAARLIKLKRLVNEFLNGEK